jgi:endonuclease/exonuclease/phosphatase (EEP) superfamily protein YafD
MSPVTVVGPDRDATRRRPAGGQGMLLTLAGLSLVPAVATTVMRLVPPTDDATALLASFIAYGVIAYAVALLCLVVALLRARRRLALAVCSAVVALLAVLHLAWLGPLFVSDHRVGRTPAFTVMSLNMYAGSADPAAIVEAAQQADIVVLVEVTPEAVQALERKGWDQRFRYSVGSTLQGVAGTAVYSRFPLSQASRIEPTQFEQWSMVAEVPGVGPVRLLAVHPCNPFCGGGRWTTEHRLLREAVGQDQGAPIIMAGDFNAVLDHGPMQQLHRIGLRSVDDVAGTGWMPTYPANRRIPPLLPIDHVLINNRLTATTVKTLAIPRTDHLGLLTTLAGT